VLRRKPHYRGTRDGANPWVRPWEPEKAGCPRAPFNPVTGKRYHGINVLILGMDFRAFTTGDPRWMTYQQAQEKIMAGPEG
jgi:antirestriction protein ArdC